MKIHTTKNRYLLPSIISGALLFLILIHTSFTNLVIGNIFFGKVPVLYNVTLANFFFKRASYPLFQKPVMLAHYQLGRTYFIQGKLEHALMEIEKEVSLYPENKHSYYMLGLTYAYLNKERLAIESFDAFLEWMPDSWAGRNDKAWLEFRIGKIDDALETIEPVAHLTDNPWVQNTYGVILMNKGEYQKAQTAFLYAKTTALSLTDEGWGKAYPGNDPRIYSMGLDAMRKSIENNLQLITKKLTG